MKELMELSKLVSWVEMVAMSVSIWAAVRLLWTPGRARAGRMRERVARWVSCMLAMKNRLVMWGCYCSCGKLSWFCAVYF